MKLVDQRGGNLVTVIGDKYVCKDGPVFRAEEVELLTPDEQRERIASGIMIKKEEQA